MSRSRHVRLRAFAKLNLHLRVLAKRGDGFHELRTVFQTVSLADVIDVAFTPSRHSRVELRADVDVPDNLMIRAAETVLSTMRVSARVEFHLRKVIPMGAGLGGGSSDAAAVLLALPVLAQRRLDFAQLMGLAAQLGSDVPFFLMGGAAVGIGRGTEIYPLPDLPAAQGLVVVPDVAVSTADAYRCLSPRLTTESIENKIFSFQSQVWAGSVLGGVNDFETVIFDRFPKLASVKRRLLRAGAYAAMMTGSGAALFGLFRTRSELIRAQESFKEEQVFPIMLVSRARYQSFWRRVLGPQQIQDDLWPPRSRYAR